MMEIRLSPSEIKRLNEILEGGYSRKIDAIKFVRTASHHRAGPPNPPPGAIHSTTDIGLGEAKDAVEVLMAERGMSDIEGNPLPPLTNPRARIVPLQPIKRIVVDMGSGEVEVDLDGMSLQFLGQMNRIPLSDVAALVDLYKRVNDWVNDWVKEQGWEG